MRKICAGTAQKVGRPLLSLRFPSLVPQERQVNLSGPSSVMCIFRMLSSEDNLQEGGLNLPWKMANQVLPGTVGIQSRERWGQSGPVDSPNNDNRLQQRVCP